MKSIVWFAVLQLFVSGVAAAQVPIIPEIAPPPPFLSGSIGVFQNGVWSLDRNWNHSWDAGDYPPVAFGQTGDEPVVISSPQSCGASQAADIAVVHNGTQWLETNNWGATANPFEFAEPGIPLAWHVTWSAFPFLTTYSTSRAGTWLIDANNDRQTSAGDWENQGFGQLGDRPILGIWRSGNNPSMGVFNAGVWWVDANVSGVWDGGDEMYNFGSPGDIPVTIDLVGGGAGPTQRIGVFQHGVWSIDANGNHHWDGPEGGDVVWEFGSTGDIPVVARGSWEVGPCPPIN